VREVVERYAGAVVFVEFEPSMSPLDPLEAAFTEYHTASDRPLFLGWHGYHV